MGVDARMLVQLSEPISDETLIAAAFGLAEAMGHDRRVFWLSNDEDVARGERRRALNRPTDDYECYNVATLGDPRWLLVSLWGRYYGEGYERGDVWVFIAIAEWLEQRFPGCQVFYGGDSGYTLPRFDRARRAELIAHWAKVGGRPYYGGREDVLVNENRPQSPICPLCEQRATQYGFGGSYAMWGCDACSRHWIWIGGKRIKAFGPDLDFNSFEESKIMREEAQSLA